MKAWTLSANWQKRRPWGGLPCRARAHCEECGAALDYDLGSIRWQCVERDLCGWCAGEAAAKRIFEKMKQRNA